MFEQVIGLSIEDKIRLQLIGDIRRAGFRPSVHNGRIGYLHGPGCHHDALDATGHCGQINCYNYVGNCTYNFDGITVRSLEIGRAAYPVY